MVRTLCVVEDVTVPTPTVCGLPMRKLCTQWMRSGGDIEMVDFSDHLVALNGVKLIS